MTLKEFATGVLDTGAGCDVFLKNRYTWPSYLTVLDKDAWEVVLVDLEGSFIPFGIRMSTEIFSPAVNWVAHFLWKLLFLPMEDRILQMLSKRNYRHFSPFREHTVLHY